MFSFKLRSRSIGDGRGEIIFIYSPHTLHPTPYTPHPTPHTLHPTPHFSHDRSSNS
ncbi:hypothetical protein [Microcystis sp. M169S2]|uniref:hypothetical protein n=1 Tax=Microcystis sp. M169S2 TaxID=2771157 RepID=UPI002586A7E9|nr:hypothetical protein [Microcystis sp. M169S2]